ncbi:MAG: hypothetical protein JNK23_09560 [Opitutaceae bacterium]|nr:hypothetical protein [Opitutaceae bacterium]
MKRSFLPALLAVLAPAGIQAADIVVTAPITASTTWVRTNTYILDTKIFVEAGATLTIEPGTVIKGRPKANPADATALIITRGARINAAGTAAQPIIFTAEADNLSAAAPSLTESDRGLWGGVVILGRARINTASGQGNVEGIATTDPRGIYGGSDDDDNSGVFRYVQIRHPGAIVAPNVELNGLTMGAVGRGTTIEYVEVFASNDDGFEWFGGTVNTKYLISAFNDDDNFDWDEGFRGKGQFWFAIGAADKGNQAMEMDGGTTPENGTPFATPEVFNATLIGSGATSGQSLSQGLIFRDNTGGRLINSIVHDYFGYAVRIETESAQTEDSAKRLAAGDLLLAANIFGSFGAGTADAQLFLSPNATSGGPAPASNYTAEHIRAAAQGNRINTNPLLNGLSRTRNRGLDPRPANGSPARTGARTPPADGFFTQTDYVGAFKDSNWAKGWTAISQLGYLTEADAPATEEPVVLGSTSKVINISTRGTLAAGGTLFGGFVIGGPQSQTVLIRVVGPGLTAFGVTNALADPTLELFSGTSSIASNDDWSGPQIPALTAAVGGFALTPGSRDAALVKTLAPGAYSVQAKGKGTAAGEVILEVYEVD